ncbi:Protein RST1 [Camellia lanceoleosa]|uniref:Protein RST1 n=1 Tax=Camellia lanceoleosa TaxID=1840588 RepID=A0ACC0GPB6_9ERIC|nr:Protein RST1 [Camellia lanceoleosa]
MVGYYWLQNPKLASKSILRLQIENKLEVVCKFANNVISGKDSFYIMGPLLSCPVLESQLTSLVQEMFLVAQNSDDHQLQRYAAWAVSFLRHCLWFRELQNTESSFPSDAASQKYVSQNFLKDNVVKELSLWLMHLNYPGVAPRLPALDWGAIIRRGMKYEGQIAESLSPDLAFKSGILGEKCLQLSLAHANQFDPLLSFLDELSDLSRFRTLELNLQSWFLSHLADLIKIFSGSGLEKLFDDVANFLSSLLSGEVCTVEQKSFVGFMLEWSVSLYRNFS